MKQTIGQGFGPKQATAIVIREFNKQFIVKFFLILFFFTTDVSRTKLFSDGRECNGVESIEKILHFQNIV